MISVPDGLSASSVKSKAAARGSEEMDALQPANIWFITTKAKADGGFFLASIDRATTDNCFETLILRGERQVLLGQFEGPTFGQSPCVERCTRGIR